MPLPIPAGAYCGSVIYFSRTFSQKRWRIAAVCARTALPCGVRSQFSPTMRPLPVTAMLLSLQETLSAARLVVSATVPPVPVIVPWLIRLLSQATAMKHSFAVLKIAVLPPLFAEEHN